MHLRPLETTNADDGATTNTQSVPIYVDRSTTARLDDDDRLIVWLHDVEGYRHSEIAAVFGKTESFSKSQLSRAYQKLRPLLAQGLESGGAELVRGV